MIAQKWKLFYWIIVSACNCDLAGSIGSTCDDSGLCHCKPNFDGAKCDKCKEQYYNYPACEECNCDPRGVIATFAGFTTAINNFCSSSESLFYLHK